jgi:hypothetical protein
MEITTDTMPWEVVRSWYDGEKETTVARCSSFEDATVVANRYPNTFISNRASGIRLYRHEKTVIEYI